MRAQYFGEDLHVSRSPFWTGFGENEIPRPAALSLVGLGYLQTEIVLPAPEQIFDRTNNAQAWSSAQELTSANENSEYRLPIGRLSSLSDRVRKPECTSKRFSVD